jgi:hypothetical protein
MLLEVKQQDFSMILEHYLNLKTRNSRAKELRAQGYQVTVRASYNQQIHPQYIADWVGPEKNDTGFGNLVYKTFVAKLYGLEAR